MKRTFFHPLSIALGTAFLLASPLLCPHALSAPVQREFTVVAANSPLYDSLQEIRRAGWTGIGDAAPEGSTPFAGSGLTRYEMALETAKAIFTIQARQGANAAWSENARPESLRALRELSRALKSELVRLEIKVDAAILLMDQLLKTQASTSSRPSADKTPIRTSLNLSTTPDSRDSISLSPADEISLPLSQRLRVYGALSSLAREKNDFLHAGANALTQDIFSLRTPNENTGSVNVRMGTSVAVTESLQLRAGMERHSPENLFIGNTSFFKPAPDATRTLRSGLDFTLRPGVVLTGSVARVQGFDPDATAGGILVNGTRLEGGIGLSGWQNRVALSAHLARLIPEDSPAFGTTAAQFNLGVEVTRQVQLKLLFRQMFDNPQSSGSARKISGGININF